MKHLHTDLLPLKRTFGINGSMAWSTVQLQDDLLFKKQQGSLVVGCSTGNGKVAGSSPWSAFRDDDLHLEK